MKDHRLVRIALFLFLVAVSLIYAVFVQVREDEIRKDVMTIVQSAGLFSGATMAPEVTAGSVETWEQILSGDEVDPIDTGFLLDDQDSFLNEVLWTWVTTILSGTELYYGSLDIFKTLGIRYEYILKDSLYDIFYVYIGKNTSYNLQDIAKELGWKTVEIYAKNDIINNLYFWDRVTFLELPQASTTITSYFVRMGSDLWFIQDVTGEYKKHKRHIRSVFTWK